MYFNYIFSAAMSATARPALVRMNASRKRTRSSDSDEGTEDEHMDTEAAKWVDTKYILAMPGSVKYLITVGAGGIITSPDASVVIKQICESKRLWQLKVQDETGRAAWLKVDVDPNTYEVTRLSQCNDMLTSVTRLHF